MTPDTYIDPWTGDGQCDEGVPVWLDITDEHHSCDLSHVPTDNPRFECARTAERRYGDYRACNYHFERARQWAIDDHCEHLAEAEQARREGR